MIVEPVPQSYWPAHYFIDARGKIRYEHFGEGDYDQSER
jgi:hypothetical protein